MDYIITYDLGTSGIKCGLFDQTLSCCGITHGDYTVTMRPDGTALADPEAYYAGLVSCTRALLAEHPVPCESIRSLCITTQGETLIAVDAEGTPLLPAIVWLDGRAEQEAAWLRGQIPDALFRQKTGLPGIDRYVPLAKLLHIKNNQPEVFRKTEKFLLLEDYLLYRLTGKWVSEKSLLSSTGYFDLQTDDIWQEALALIGVRRSMLPQVLEPGACVGSLTRSAAQDLGLAVGTLAYAGAMDQVAGAVGCGNFVIGAAHEATGTAMVTAATLPLKTCMERSGLLTVYRHIFPDRYLLLAISRTATAVLKWFAEQFYRDLPRENIYTYLSSVAETVPPGANGIFLLPFFEGHAENDKVKGTFFHVGLHNSREDFVRGIFEGVAYMLKDDLRLLFGEDPINQLVSIGGASKSETWCRIKADITGSRIVTIDQPEAALFGCACIAAVGSGWYASMDEAVSTQKGGRDYLPVEENRRYYEKQYAKYGQIKELVLKWN